MDKFRLTETFLEKYKKQKAPFGFNGLGELVYLRTYSRIKPNGENERWWETVQRVVEGTFNMQKRWIDDHRLGWNSQKAQKSAQEMYERIFNMKFLPPGRGLWAMGSPITEERGLNMALNNCAFVSSVNIKEDLSKIFCFLMDVSMLGVGCGFDTKGTGKISVKKPIECSTNIYKIPDTREGWVESIRLLIDSYFVGSRDVTFDYSEIRKAGLPIKGFGGISSGSEPLKELHDGIRFTLQKNIDKPITVTSIVDIMNMIGKCVVAGNVRRCIPRGTLIHTQEGLIKVENIKPGMLAKTSKGYSPISELVYQGKQPVLNIKTQLGSFYCTDKHKMARLVSPIEYEWIQAKNLSVGDKLVFVEYENEGEKTNLPSYSYCKPTKSTTCKDITIPILDPDISWFFGLFHGDGYVYPNFEENGFNAYVSIACSTMYPKIIEDCQILIKRFGVNTCDTLPSEEDNCYKIRVVSKQLAFYLSQFKSARKEICVPEFILRGTKEIRASYLAGLFDSDGSKNNRPLVAISSIYPEFIKTIQALYSTLGIPTRLKLRREASNNWNALYELTIVGERTKKRFFDLILPFSRCQIKENKTSRSQNDFTFPLEWVKNKGGSYNESMTISTYIENGNEFNGLIPIEVKSITHEDEDVETYDISVPNAEEFVCQSGILVHNTAEIVFGDYKSDEYLDLKNYSINKYRENFGWTSNNSIFCDLGMNYSNSVSRTKINGEPGYAWLHNMQAYSRMNNGPDWKDRRVEGGNPCLEQSLESYEVCNLVETFPANHETLDDYLITLKYAYLYAKTVTLGQTHWPETNRVMLRNRRIGCSMSGIAQFVTDRGIHELKKWCEEGYKKIEYYDEIYSDWLAIPKSVKKTSIKPSGTVSLLAGATPGVHFPENVCYIRRMRLSKHSDLIAPLEDAGYKIEPCFGSEDSTVVVEVPVRISDRIRAVKDVSMWEQLALAAFMQRYWADNQVSCTVTFRKDEENQIEHALNFYQYQLKGISFLPATETKAFRQMPYEAISSQEYDKLISKIKPIHWKKIKNEEADVEKFCNNDHCEIKLKVK